MNDISLEEIEFVDAREREALAEALLGESVRDFLRSDVGRFLHGRAKQDFEEAKAELIDCNLLTFWGRRKARQLQQRATTARSFMRYCVEAIQAADIASKELEEYENARARGVR